MRTDEERGIAPQTAPPQGVATTAATGEGCRVFLVEDEADDRLFSQRQLEACGKVQEVKCFANGEDLIKYMREQGFEDRSVMCMTPTVIIVDLNMPRMDGFKVLERLKSDRFLEEIPIVVLSGELSYETIRRALDLRADGVLRKPLNTEKMAEFFRHAWQWPTKEMWLS
ncbi:MAG: response regulator [Micavibrio sp.]|nr:response regulator [Micavibrio sp.]